LHYFFAFCVNPPITCFRPDDGYHLTTTNLTVMGGGQFITRGRMHIDAAYQVAVYSGGSLSLDGGG